MKTNIIKTVVSELTSLTLNVHRRFLYLEEINDFPTIILFAGDESRKYLGAGQKEGAFLLNIRGYLFTDENSLDDAEDLANEIDSVIRNMSKIDNLIDMRVLTINTDEGILSPYGMCNLLVEVVYQI